MEQYKEVIRCPECRSESINFDKKGFGFGKAVAGVLLVNPLGALAGFIGSNKIKATCLACGKKFNPEEGYMKIAIPSERHESITPSRISSSIRSKNNLKTANDYSEDEIAKKISIWEDFCRRGLITQEELDKRKSDFLGESL